MSIFHQVQLSTNKDFNQLSRSVIGRCQFPTGSLKCKNLSLIRGTKMSGSLGGSAWPHCFINSSIRSANTPWAHIRSTILELGCHVSTFQANSVHSERRSEV